MADTDISGDENLDEDGEGAKPAPPPAKKGNKKLIIFTLAGLLVAGGAGGGAFVFLGKDDVAEAEDEPPVIEELRRIGYVNIKPIFVQVETDKGELQNLVVELALEVEKGSRDEERIKQAMPFLFEAYLRTLTARPIPGAADGKAEVTHIKNRIRAENLRILGPGAVHNVILRNIWFTKD
jgi:flagellar FliL protein